MISQGSGVLTIGGPAISERARTAIYREHTSVSREPTADLALGRSAAGILPQFSRQVISTRLVVHSQRATDTPAPNADAGSCSTGYSGAADSGARGRTETRGRE